MKIAYKIILRVFVMIILLVIMNSIYVHFFFEEDIQEHSEVINLVRAIPNDADVVYIGESSNSSSDSRDIDKRYISAFIADYFPELKVFDITKPASHAGNYKILLRKIPESSNISTLIVTLNLRSFNAQWIYSDLETPLQKSMVLLKNYPAFLNRFLLSFKGYDIKSNKEREAQFKRKWERDKFDVPFSLPYKHVREWDADMWNVGIKAEDGTKDQALSELACHFIKCYAFQVDTHTNPRIADFNDIIKLAKERNWKVIFNLMAENHEKGNLLVGENLVYFMEYNRKLLIDYYENRGARVVDNLYAVEDEQFTDQHWTTEHYAEKGRKTIAANVAKEMKNIYPDKYVEANHSNYVQSSFFTDCEGNVQWSQNSTITDEQSFSGNKSSKTGNGQEYSLTFEYPFHYIPDSLKNTVNVKINVFQSSIHHDSKLIFEARGKNIKYYEAVPLVEHSKKVNEWDSINYSFKVTEEFIAADLVKVYVWNTSDQLIYIDDFKIDFK